MIDKPQLVSKHILVNVPVAEINSKAGEVVKNLADKKYNFDSIGYIYILDNKKLAGVVSIKELLLASAGAAMSKIMTAKVATVHPKSDLERAAIVAIEHNIKAVPVVDREGLFLGVVGIHDILHILHKERVEYMLRIGGVQIVEQKHVLEMLGDRVGQLLRIRMPWLIVGLFGGMIATLIVGFFESAISENVALAFFIPIIVYMTDAVGTQAQTLFIRALMIKKILLWRYLVKEFFVDLSLGALLGLVVAIFGLVWNKGSAGVALVVGLAMAVNIISAGFVAILISWILFKFKRDPAIGAGPFSSVIQGILSIIIYFVIAIILL